MASGYLALWWGALLSPARAAGMVLARGAPPRFFGLLSAAILVLYAVYGAGMGLFHGTFAGVMSALKMLVLYGATLLICFPAFYVANCLVGPRLPLSACVRLLILAVSANAATLSSYTPLSYFFTFTTSADGYSFIVFMHVVVFGLASLISLTVITSIFRAAALSASRPIRPLAVWIWGVLYGFVGSEVAWVLRPFIGSPNMRFQVFRPRSGNFYESVLDSAQDLFRDD